MQGQYNMRNPAVKRLMKEAQELREPTEQYYAQPLEDNLFEWHFTIRGPVDSEFEDGVYHGRIILPPEYPMKPPSIILLTPNGRFEVFKKICLSISGHHPESWQPSWSIRTALLAIIGFMPTHGNGAIGSLDYTTEERKVLARRSQEFKCQDCGTIKDKLKAVTEASKAETQEAKELASQINFQAENKANGKDKEEKQEKEPESEEKADEKTSTETTDNDSESSPVTADPTDPQVPVGFPGYNHFPGMPFHSGGFPIAPPMMFPAGMVPPPASSGNGATSNPSSPFVMPSSFMMPPMIPMIPMIPPSSIATSYPSQVPQGPFPPYLSSPFLASPAAMMAQQQAFRSYQANSSASSHSSANKSRSATTTVSSVSASYKSSSQVTKADKKEETTPELATSSTEGASTSTAASTEGASTSTAATASSSSTPAAETPTTSATASVPRSTPAPELRQRNVLQNVGLRAPPGQGHFQNAALPAEPNIHHSEHPLLILLMVLIGIAILALLVRRICMMNTWRFDTDF